jgi:hypothetical protein
MQMEIDADITLHKTQMRRHGSNVGMLSSGVREISLSIQSSRDGTNNTPQIAPDQQHTTTIDTRILVHHIISRYLRPPLQKISVSCLHLLSVLSAEPRSLYT